MFEYIKGKLTESSPMKAIVDISGLGYRILIPLSNYAKLPQLGQEVLLYLSPIIREDAHTLYGFLTRHERDLFEKFTNISGIGPKTALALIGHMDISQLQFAISQSNISALCKIPGIGKKTAERLIIEMRDKIKGQDIPHEGPQGTAFDAISALINLGYQPAHAQKAIKSALGSVKDEPDLPSLITLALRHL